MRQEMMKEQAIKEEYRMRTEEAEQHIEELVQKVRMCVCSGTSQHGTRFEALLGDSCAESRALLSTRQPLNASRSAGGDEAP